MKKKRRVLVYGDSPTTATGFATVIRNILKEVHHTGEYEIDVIGINYYDGWYDREKYPYKIVPAMMVGEQDFYGRAHLIQALLGYHKVLKPPYDILFTLQDPFILEPVASTINGIKKAFIDPDHEPLASPFINRGQPTKLQDVPDDWPFTWIAYWPVDSALKLNWVRDAILLPDYSVAYTQYGKKQINQYNYNDKNFKRVKKIRVIPHGVNTRDFFPISKQEKKRFRKVFFEGKVGEDDFLLTNISRNQPRKNIPATLKTFRAIKARIPKAKLYLHMKAQDAGGNIHEIATAVNLKENKDYIIPPKFDENVGFPLETLNKIYNVSDVLLTTTLGEGWGFILTEAMAARSTIVAPRNTSIPEILGDDRGFIYECGATDSEWVCLGVTDNERFRPLPNVDSAAEIVEYIYNNRDEAERRIARAYRWVKNFSWEKVCEDWIKLFALASKRPRKKPSAKIIDEAIKAVKNENNL